MSEHIIEIKLFTRLLNEKLKDNEVLNIVNNTSSKLTKYKNFKVDKVKSLNTLMYFTCSNENDTFYILFFLSNNCYWKLTDNKIDSFTFYMKLKSGSYMNLLDTESETIIKFVYDKNVFNTYTYIYGPDTLSVEFNIKYWEKITKNNYSNVTVFLMDKSNFVGITNTMKSDILNEANISPYRRINDLKEDELFNLFNAIQFLSRLHYNKSCSEKFNKSEYKNYFIFGNKDFKCSVTQDKNITYVKRRNKKR